MKLTEAFKCCFRRKRAVGVNDVKIEAMRTGKKSWKCRIGDIIDSLVNCCKKLNSSSIASDMTVCGEESIVSAIGPSMQALASTQQQPKLFKLAKRQRWRKFRRVLQSNTSLCRERDETGLTLLGVAVGYHAPLDIVQLIHSHDPDQLTATDKFGANCLHLACLNGASVPTIRFILDKEPSLAKTKDNDRRTALHHVTECVCRGKIHLREWLDVTNVLCRLDPTLIHASSKDNDSPLDLTHIVVCKNGLRMKDEKRMGEVTRHLREISVSEYNKKKKMWEAGIGIGSASASVLDANKTSTESDKSNSSISSLPSIASDMAVYGKERANSIGPSMQALAGTKQQPKLFKLVKRQRWRKLRRILQSNTSQEAASLCKERNDTGLTLLSAAVGFHAPLDIVQLIHSHDPDQLTATDKFGANCLHVACLNGASVPTIRFILDKEPSLAKTRDNNRQTALHHVTECVCRDGMHLMEWRDVVDVLCRLDPTLIHASSKDNDSPLDLTHIVVCKNDLRMDDKERVGLVTMYLRHISIREYKKKKKMWEAGIGIGSASASVLDAKSSTESDEVIAHMQNATTTNTSMADTPYEDDSNDDAGSEWYTYS